MFFNSPDYICAATIHSSTTVQNDTVSSRVIGLRKKGVFVRIVISIKKPVVNNIWGVLSLFSKNCF